MGLDEPDPANQYFMAAAHRLRFHVSSYHRVFEPFPEGPDVRCVFTTRDNIGVNRMPSEGVL